MKSWFRLTDIQIIRLIKSANTQSTRFNSAAKFWLNPPYQECVFLGIFRQFLVGSIIRTRCSTKVRKVDVRPVPREPVSAAISLLTGKIQGKMCVLRRYWSFSAVLAPNRTTITVPYWPFPCYSKNRENNIRNWETYDANREYFGKNGEANMSPNVVIAKRRFSSGKRSGRSAGLYLIDFRFRFHALDLISAPRGDSSPNTDHF